MPSIRRRIAATTTDALANVLFNVVPTIGCLLSLWAAGVTATDDIGLLIGNQAILAQGTDVNIEISADVLDNDRDQLVFQERINGAGQLTAPVTVTTEMQFLIALRYGVR